MARHYANLSHHESLRYDYLQKNIHYLSERDRAELHYLEAKIAGQASQSPYRVSRRRPEPVDLPAYSPLSKKRQVEPKPQRTPIRDMQEMTPEGLPVLESRRTRSQKGYRPLQSSSDRTKKQEGTALNPTTSHKKATQTIKQSRSQSASSQPPEVEVYASIEDMARQLHRESQERQSMPQNRIETRQSGHRIETESPENKPALAKHSSKKAPKIPKPQKGWGKTILEGVGLLFLISVIGMFLMFLKGYHDAKSIEANAEAAEVEFFDGQETRDGTNILVLGTDSRIGQVSAEARTDTIMVVNIGNADGKIKIVSFMRDTLINIPEVSYEDGLNTYYDQKLNTAFSIGEQNDKQGAEAIRIALKSHYDIDIKYYAMVDFQTFAAAIDTLFPNGVTIDAQFATVDGDKVDSVQVPDDLNMKDGVVPEQTIEIGEQQMDGRTLLNYARFRKDDAGDFGRTERQQQVLTAILQQVKDPTKLFTGSAAVGKIMGMTSTNVPYSFILSQGVSVISDAANGIEQTTVPAAGDWVDEYDMYGGQGLLVDFESYQDKLYELGLR
ncbi:LCP family protein [Streptococcus moroccensis]|uniref:Regulatory protein MsrR n=1 Tax=Streptococcus moroccensis TaxID=1451356 RepID=A0ABT9YVL3_9STRE|nr:LCP family protein [Streptococcus moroccensis]MDQ0223368.1 LCP family protein required for cell wall assembly [Streptococcus moroccensis]